MQTCVASGPTDNTVLLHGETESPCVIGSSE